MALKSVDNLIEGKTLTPNSEMERINEIKRNRKLYQGDLSSLGVGYIIERERGFPEIDNDGVVYQNKVNWFRRAADFYPEFMFSNFPDIDTGNPRMNDVIEDMKDTFIGSLQDANVDMLASGEGIVAANPVNPLRFIAWAPDAHYVITDERGIITGDVLVNVRAARAGDQTDEIDIITYYVDPEKNNTWDTYVYAAGNVGSFVRFNVVQPTLGRQVVEIHANKGKTSIFEDMKDGVGEMGRTLSNLSVTLKRNSNPHLAGPSGMLTVDAQGNYVLDPDGMFLPVEEGERNPEYIVYDPTLDAVQWDYKQSEKNALAAAGLSDAIFDASLFTGVISGTALRRILLPFVARLESYVNANDTAIVQMLEIHNRNRQALGVETFSLNRRDIEITWHHRELFEAEEKNGQPNDVESSIGN